MRRTCFAPESRSHIIITSSSVVCRRRRTGQERLMWWRAPNQGSSACCPTGPPALWSRRRRQPLRPPAACWGSEAGAELALAVAVACRRVSGGACDCPHAQRACEVPLQPSLAVHGVRLTAPRPGASSSRPHTTRSADPLSSLCPHRLNATRSWLRMQMIPTVPMYSLFSASHIIIYASVSFD